MNDSLELQVWVKQGIARVFMLRNACGTDDHAAAQTGALYLRAHTPAKRRHTGNVDTQARARAAPFKHTAHLESQHITLNEQLRSANIAAN